MTTKRRDELAEALTRDPRDGSWTMTPKGAFLKGYDQGRNDAIEEALFLVQNYAWNDKKTTLIDKIKSLKER